MNDFNTSRRRLVVVRGSTTRNHGRGMFPGHDPRRRRTGSRRRPLRPSSPPSRQSNNAISVPVGSTVAITFDKAMAAGSTFAVTCAAPCVNPTGTVALSAGGTVATYTLTPSTSFAPLTLYTVTANAPMSAGGLPLVTPFVSQFITAGTTADTNRPRVSSTSPATTSPGPTPGVPTNASVAAVFSKDMNQASVEAPATFTVTCVTPCVSPAGVVSYSVGSRTAVFVPSAPLVTATTYTATISTAAMDLAGNTLAGNQAALPAASAYRLDLHHGGCGRCRRDHRAIDQPARGGDRLYAPTRPSMRLSPCPPACA